MQKCHFGEKPFELAGHWYIEGTSESGDPSIALEIPEAYVALFAIAQRTESSLRRSMRDDVRRISRSLVATMLDPVLTSYHFMRGKVLCELQFRGKRVENCDPWYAALFSMVWQKPLLVTDDALIARPDEKSELREYHTRSLFLALRLLDKRQKRTEANIYRELARRDNLTNLLDRLGNQI